MVLADAALPAVQALIRWDPVRFAERELAERAELGFPPAVRMAAVTGEPEAVAGSLGAAALPAGAEVLGPVPVEAAPAAQARSGRCARSSGSPRDQGAALARALHAAQATRSARKDAGAVRVQLDPAEVI